MALPKLLQKLFQNNGGGAQLKTEIIPALTEIVPPTGSADGAKGYWRDSQSGFQVCWGTDTVQSGTESTTITLPAAFNNSYYQVIASTRNTNLSWAPIIGARIVDSSSFTVVVYDASSGAYLTNNGFRWIAIGTYK